MSGHTPGPWGINGPSKPSADTPEGGDYSILDGGTNIIAETFNRVSHGVGGLRPALANARLIAAAPDLLAVLEEIEFEGVIPDGFTKLNKAVSDVIAAATVGKP